jgi:hypothetical protein
MFANYCRLGESSRICGRSPHRGDEAAPRLIDGGFRQRDRCYCRRNLYRIWWRATRTGRADKPSDVAEDDRVVILSGLVANKRRIRAVHRSELVLSNIGDPGRLAKEESLHGNDVNCIDPADAIHISSGQPASPFTQ